MSLNTGKTFLTHELCVSMLMHSKLPVSMLRHIVGDKIMEIRVWSVVLQFRCFSGIYIIRHL